MPNWTPMEWPNEWREEARLELLKSTLINFLLVDRSTDFDAIRTGATRMGIEAGDAASLPNGVRLVKGDWPGVRLSANGGDTASAGPTGEPWVNMNGWRVAVESALSGNAKCWISARPNENAVLNSASYRTAVSDTAAAGGRWVLALNSPLAKGIAERNPGAMGIWKDAVSSAEFFARQSEWAHWSPAGTIGVVSDFVGRNKGMSPELVNLIGRAGSHYRVIPKKNNEAPFDGLRALLYADSEAPDARLRQRVLDFVNLGGTLITTPRWGEPEGAPGRTTRLGYRSFSLGKGRIEITDGRDVDPFTLANDAVVIVSHRYDLARLWNSGAHASFCSTSADGKRMLAQFLIYSDQAATEVTAWVAGRYRAAKLYTMDMAPRSIDIIGKAGGAEFQLPVIRQYAAIELEKT